jgi:hypothetical protein
VCSIVIAPFFYGGECISTPWKRDFWQNKGTCRKEWNSSLSYAMLDAGQPELAQGFCPVLLE